MCLCKVVISDIAELTEEVKAVEFTSKVCAGSVSSKIVATIEVRGQNSFDSNKQAMLDSAKSLATWSLSKPGSDDAYKNVLVQFDDTGETRYELMDAFVISYREWFEDQNGFFVLVMKGLKSGINDAESDAGIIENELPITVKDDTIDDGQDAPKSEPSEPSEIYESEQGVPLIVGGVFLLDALESDYKKYEQRKLNEGKVPRGRLDWKETRDYWLNDSPMARGNRFDDTAELNGWYPFDQVHLSNGKRLDSYDLDKGEIISRKATDLDDIEEDTFKQYLAEMNNKYPPGTIIRSNKYKEELDGKKLKGRHILELPDSNENSPNIGRYKEMAKENGVELRFRKE